MLRHRQRTRGPGGLVVVDDPAALKRLEERRAEALTALRVEQLEEVRDETLQVRMRTAGKTRDRADRLLKSVEADLDFLGSARKLADTDAEPQVDEQSVRTAQQFDKLESKQRRQVAAAVSAGRVVDDYELAPVAILWAQQILDAAGDGWSLWSLRDWISLVRTYHRQRAGARWSPVLGWILSLAVWAPILVGIRHITFVLPLVFLHVGLTVWAIDRFASEGPRRAQQSKTANLYLLESRRR